MKSLNVFLTRLDDGVFLWHNEAVPDNPKQAVRSMRARVEAQVVKAYALPWKCPKKGMDVIGSPDGTDSEKQPGVDLAAIEEMFRTSEVVHLADAQGRDIVVFKDGGKKDLFHATEILTKTIRQGITIQNKGKEDLSGTSVRWHKFQAKISFESFFDDLNEAYGDGHDCERGCGSVDD